MKLSPSNPAAWMVGILIGLAPACTTTPYRGTCGPPRSLDPELSERFGVPPLELVTAGEPQADGPSWRHDGVLEIDGVELRYRYWLPGEDARPAPFVMVLPFLSGAERITDLVCRALARRGIAAGSVERRWRLFKEKETVDELEAKFVDAVRAQRAFLAWVAEREGIDGERIGCLGISIGGMLATLFAAVEPRLDCAVICLAGGDFGELVVSADEVQLERWVRERLTADGISAAELQERIRREFEVDPLRLAPAVDPCRVLFVTARWDGVIPRPSREALWHALGQPERIDVPLGHYTTFLALNWILGRASRFATSRFAEDPSPIGEPSISSAH
jgi:dienelactone hydrolase